MKKLLSYLVVSTFILGLFTMASCDDGGIPITLPQEIDQTFVISATADTAFLVTKEVSGNFDSVLQSKGYTRDNVDAIIIFGAQIGQVDTVGNTIKDNFYELDTVKLYLGDVSLPITSDSVVAFVPYLGSLSYGQTGFTGFILQNTALDIIPYVTKPKYRISMRGKSRYPITKDLYYRIKINTNITVSGTI